MLNLLQVNGLKKFRLKWSREREITGGKFKRPRRKRLVEIKPKREKK